MTNSSSGFLPERLEPGILPKIIQFFPLKKKKPKTVLAVVASVPALSILLDLWPAHHRDHLIYHRLIFA